jgi:hypothetical protein
MRLVKDIKLLTKMEKDGFIVLHPQTGEKVTWYGNTLTAWYIDEAKKRCFTYKNRKFEEVYVDGSFFPYLYEEV